jgi:hypothetical protein
MCSDFQMDGFVGGFRRSACVLGGFLIHTAPAITSAN